MLTPIISNLVDIHAGLTYVADQAAGSYSHVDGFKLSEIETYFVEAYDATTILQTLFPTVNNTHVLRFNGLDQALMTNPESTDEVLNSNTLYLSLLCYFEDFPVELINGSTNVATFFSTRANYDVGLDAASLEHQGPNPSELSGINLGVVNSGTVDQPIFKLVVSYNSTVGQSFSQELPRGTWQHIVVEKVKSSPGASTSNIKVYQNNMNNPCITMFNVPDDDLPHNRMIIGATVHGNPFVPDDLEVINYFPMRVANLAIWNNSSFDVTNIIKNKTLTLTKPEFLVKYTNVEADALDPELMDSLSELITFSPTSSQLSKIIEDDTKLRYNAIIHGKYNEGLTVVDTDAGCSVAVFDGKDDYIVLRDQSVIQQSDGRYTRNGSLRQYRYFDFAGPFTFNMWFKPKEDYRQYLNNSYSFVNIEEKLASCLFSTVPSISTLDIAEGNNRYGLDISFGYDSGDLTQAFVTVRLVIPFGIGTGGTLITTENAIAVQYLDEWPWYNLQVTYGLNGDDIKLITYVTEQSGVPDVQEDTPDQNTSGIYPDTNVTYANTDARTRFSDIYIGGRAFSDIDGIQDLFVGRICDVWVKKSVKTADYLDVERYKIVSA